MALVPMNQIITVTPAMVDEEGNPILDDAGYPMFGDPYEVKCRVDEGSKLVQNRSAGRTSSENVVATARILIDKLAPVKYGDKISYTNELNETIERSPKEINPKRMISGKPTMTEVII